MTTCFPIDQVNRLRDAAARSIEVGDCLEERDGCKLTDSSFDAVLEVFPALRIKQGYRLVGYLLASGDRKGVVWAVPVDADCSLSACEVSDYKIRVRPYPTRALRPAAALDHFMMAIAGDGTPWSWLSASLFARQVAEFGARRHDIRWGHESILGEDPGNRITQWNDGKPETFEPTLQTIDGRKTIVMHTYSEWGCCRVFRITDRFDPGAYSFETENETIAEGGRGYMV